ncbi:MULTISPECIES: hypothetical protein [unclassified Streptomyces]|uniref:hypothetical protein n=1 Tax=unclassified Streptomyces TaxID=2593676 RepID=UPI000DAEEDD3|nr:MULTISPECIES: hypothetical protein [unclassified Streptomyces]PZT76634.1 hypothetical protein DNK56_25360 [Streptomyces sp. AC1-42W]PZT79409.1 hypothetical protein DNK55_07320 [Streptomyces sp. AC1-42T]
MPEVIKSARTRDKPELEPVAHAECRICTAAHRGRSASRIHGNEGGVRHYNAIIEAHPHRDDQADAEHKGDETGEDSPLLIALRERVTEENGLRRSIRFGS